MINPWIIVFFALLSVSNLFILAALAHSCRKDIDTATKTGFTFMIAVLVLNVLFSAGGVFLW